MYSRCVVVVPFYCQEVSFSWIYYSLFIHSQVNGQLGSFRILAVQIKLLQLFLHESFCDHIFSFFLSKYQRMELGHRVGVCLALLSNL